MGRAPDKKLASIVPEAKNSRRPPQDSTVAIPKGCGVNWVVQSIRNHLLSVIQGGFHFFLLV